jgi:ethanolamine utilization protein EutP
MRRKRIMVIGPTNCGKTTLVNELNNITGTPRKTQDIIYGKNTIDVPGAYIENSWMYQHLIAASQDASQVLVMLDQSKCAEVYSPGFAKIFRCPVIGIISKCDLTPENEEICIKQLKRIGVKEPYYRISCQNGTGISELKSYLFENNELG